MWFVLPSLWQTYPVSPCRQSEGPQVPLPDRGPSVPGADWQPAQSAPVLLQPVRPGGLGQPSPPSPAHHRHRQRQQAGQQDRQRRQDRGAGRHWWRQHGGDANRRPAYRRWGLCQGQVRDGIRVKRICRCVKNDYLYCTMLCKNNFDSPHIHSIKSSSRRLQTQTTRLSAAYTVSENCFHDVNSRNKFLLHRQNKIFNCVHKLFYFCEWRNNSCNTY